MVTCPGCGRENPDGARFCNACAVPLAAVALEVREERKIVTVLFCDLVGFTAQAERLDPEDVRALLAPYHARLRSELERFGGTVEKFIGDAVMALFGAPVAHEDDPERAVRAALAIRDWARQEDRLEVRIAVNTGEALVRLGARLDAGEAMAAGDVVNSAARLQAAAPVNGILVGETTYRATRERIDYREHQDVQAKGKTEPLEVWEAVDARARVGMEAVSTRAPLVGRERELALLRDTLLRVREESSPQLVTVVGVPGIGKSRLVHELMRSIEAGRVLMYWRRGRSLPYGEGVSFWALAEIVKAQAGILETDSDADVEEKLASAVAATVDSDEADWVAAHLRPLVGLDTDVTAGDRRHEAFAAWRRLFEGMAEQRPLVLVFEDLHWADDALLDFVDHLAEWASSVPILILATARPELLERRPGWGGGKLNATTVSLPPLSDAETGRLFAALLERAALDDDKRQLLLAAAGGNPLYAEQYSHLAVEADRADQLALPESIQGIIAARIDRLGADEKALLQDAAVIGKLFWLGGVANGRTRSEAEQCLHALQRKGFVQRARRSTVARETEYAFPHLLVRDVAYAQIPRASRAEKHREAAAWIESLGRPDDHAEMVAHHYLAALALARTTRRPVAALVERARPVLRDAGERALRLNAFSAAARFYGEAISLCPAEDPGRPLLLLQRGRALQMTGNEETEAALTEARDALVAADDHARAGEAEVGLAELWWYRGHRDESMQHLERATALVESADASRSKAAVLAQAARYRLVAGEFERALDIGREALAMAEELELDDVQLQALITVGSARASQGDAGGVADLERSIEIAVTTNSTEASRAYNNLANFLAYSGELNRSRPVHAEALRVAERFGHVQMARFSRAMWAYECYLGGDWDESLWITTEFIAECERSPHYHEVTARSNRANIRLARGDRAAALADAERALELAHLAKDAQLLLGTLAFASRVYCALGRLADAEATARSWLEQMGDEFVSRPSFVDMAWIAGRLGFRHEVAATIERARDTLWTSAARAVLEERFSAAAATFSRIGCKPDEAEARLRTAEQLLADGQGAEANAELQEALAFYRSVRASGYIAEAETLRKETTSARS